MSIQEERICRVCLDLLNDNYETIDETTIEIFKILLLKTDLSVSDEPLMCKTCSKSMQNAFSFKSTCFSVDELIVTFVSSKNSYKIDIREVYLNENKSICTSIDEDCDVCRFCLICLQKSNFYSLNELKEDLLLTCLPELDEHVTKPMVCASCVDSLESYFNFAIKCQGVEERIQMYREVQGVDSKSQVKLNSVLKFFKSMLEDTRCDSEEHFVKKGGTLFGNKYSDINDIGVKTKEKFCPKDETDLHLLQVKPLSMDKVVKFPSQMEKESSQPSDTKLNHTYVSPSKATIYKCDICTYETNLRIKLRCHMLTTHSDDKKKQLRTPPFTDEEQEVPTYKCNFCAFQSLSSRYIKIHALKHKDSSEVTMYKCEECTYESRHKNLLRLHQLTHKDPSDVRMHKCELCPFVTKHQNYIRRHMLKHKTCTEVETFKCHMCKFETKRKQDLKPHILTHTRKQPGVAMYKCNECKFQTIYKRSIRNHMLKHNESSEVPIYRCDVCSFKTEQEASLNIHKLMHKEETTYACNLCDYNTRRKSSLGVHMLTHKDRSEVTMYKCDECTFETKYKPSLRVHRFKHNPESRVKPTPTVTYKCDSCPFETKNRTHLRLHQLAHKAAKEVKTSI